MSRTSFAPGKIILSGEYAVVFGYPGIAIPSSLGIDTVFDEDPTSPGIDLEVEGRFSDTLIQYIERIIAACQKRASSHGRLIVRKNLPIGKGMGSSTALVVAIARALFGTDARDEALRVEDQMNPGHSGLDFTTIWNAAPVLFRKSEGAIPINLSPDILRGALLIDTGVPSESTTELLGWMKSRRSEVEDILQTIGNCTERLARGEPLPSIMREHNSAQVALGVVPPAIQQMIKQIEESGGAAKVIGAGSREGGAGIVLAIGNHGAIQNIANERSMPIMSV